MAKRTESAILDRIVDGKHAVLLVGDAEREVVIPSHELPRSTGEGTWLIVTFNNDDVINITVDKERTVSTRERIEKKMNRLKRRSKFKK